MGGPTSYGKGDRARPVDPVRWAKNWERVFGERKNEPIEPSKEITDNE